jgi:hypothetical protein
MCPGPLRSGLLTSRARCSARSRLIFSSSRISSAVSSSSSSSLNVCQRERAAVHVVEPYSSLDSSSLDPAESASSSAACSNISLRLFASGSSSSSASPVASSTVRFVVAGLGSSLASTGLPFFFAKCAASAFSNSARRSRASVSAEPPWPACRNLSVVCAGRSLVWKAGPRCASLPCA